jgi:hypothetical protein
MSCCRSFGFVFYIRSLFSPQKNSCNNPVHVSVRVRITETAKYTPALIRGLYVVFYYI